MEKTRQAELRRDFSQRTSCHGLAEVYASTHKVQRIFWGLLTLAVLVVLISQLAIRIKEYTEFKTTTSISEKYTAGGLEFPAVTICNFNKYFRIVTEEEQDAIRELARSSFSGDAPEDIDKIKYFENVYNGSIRNYTIGKGWELDNETLIWCFVGGEICSVANFTFTITELGKCWTFHTDLKVTRAGSYQGLSIVVNIQQDHYSETLSYGNWEAGIKVQIHPASDVPEVDQLGLAVPVGSMGFMGLRKKEVKLMYTPWGECEPEDEALDIYQTYSAPNCFNECFRKILQKACGCRLYYYEESTELQECTPKETVNCLVNFTYFLNQYLTSDQCECQPPCHSTQYDARISYAVIPNSAILEELIKTANVSAEIARESFAGITVYYEKMGVIQEEESKAVTWTALLSDLGGQLGLWIGISVVTLFEFAQFLIMYCTEGLENIIARKKAGEKETKSQTFDNFGMTKENYTERTTSDAC